MEMVGLSRVGEKKECDWFHSSPRTLAIKCVWKQDYLVRGVGAQQWHLAIGCQFGKQGFISCPTGGRRSRQEAAVHTLPMLRLVWEHV